MVTLALEESAGIVEYDVNLALSRALVSFDPALVTTEAVVAAISQRTGYDNLTVRPSGRGAGKAATAGATNPGEGE